MSRFIAIYYVLIFYGFDASAAHIVGGEIYYHCLGSDNYLITLKVYRDCYASGPNVAYFDNPVQIMMGGKFTKRGLVLQVATEGSGM